MSGLGSSLSATALRLVERHGAPMTLTRRAAGGGYNPATDEVEVEQTTETCFGVITAWTPQEIAAGYAEAPDAKVVVAAAGLGTAPAQGDQVEIAGRVLQIVGEPQREIAGETVVTYILRGRG